MNQLELIPQAPKLTERQARALAVIQDQQPISSERLGQSLGGPAYWYEANGKDVAKALRRKGLVKYSRNAAGWVLPEWKPERKSSQGELPKGF